VKHGKKEYQRQEIRRPTVAQRGHQVDLRHRAVLELCRGAAIHPGTSILFLRILDEQEAKDGECAEGIEEELDAINKLASALLRRARSAVS
jgi:hypothetical protein